MIERIPYLDFPNSLKLTNGVCELVVTTDVGPRIMFFGLAGGKNLFGEFIHLSRKGELGEWRPFGGHRLWAAPEHPVRTYSPDNGPCSHRELGKFCVRVTPEVEVRTNLAKELEIELDEHEARASITHRICNLGLWPIELAPWALTIMAKGGTAVLPLPARADHNEALLPVSALSLWAYTDLTDPRLLLARDAVRIRMDDTRHIPLKIGLHSTEGWCAYEVGGQTFTKRFEVVPGARYPDMNSNVEVFTSGDFLELETLAPLRTLEPNEQVEYTEVWEIA